MGGNVEQGAYDHRCKHCGAGYFGEHDYNCKTRKPERDADRERGHRFLRALDTLDYKQIGRMLRGKEK